MILPSSLARIICIQLVNSSLYMTKPADVACPLTGKRIHPQVTVVAPLRPVYEYSAFGYTYTQNVEDKNTVRVIQEHDGTLVCIVHRAMSGIMEIDYISPTSRKFFEASP
jgi:hypothetical protein